MRSQGLRQVAARAESRIARRLNPVRDGNLVAEGRCKALLAQEGEYAAPARARDVFPGAASAVPSESSSPSPVVVAP